MEYCLGSASDLLEGKDKSTFPFFPFYLDQTVICAYTKAHFGQTKWLMTLRLKGYVDKPYRLHLCNVIDNIWVMIND